MNKYDAYYKNIYSQFGEDGIIQYLIDKLDIKTNGESCEVGMIGTNWSNTTRYLHHERKRFCR